MTITALSPAPAKTIPVIAAEHDLAGGTLLTDAELIPVALPPELVPAGAFRSSEELIGQVLAAPLRRGETLTDVRVVGPALVASYGARVVAAPVRIADAATVALLRPGDVIDVLAAAAPEAGRESATAAAQLVASAVPVLALPRERTGAFDAGGAETGALVVIAASESAAARLASAAVTSRLSVVIRGPAQ